MFHVQHEATFAQLVESIKNHGAILPLYHYHGGVLDGSRRARACRQLGIDIQIKLLTDPALAAQILWGLHPDRAFRTFAAQLPIREAAKLFSCPLHALLPYYRVEKPKPPFYDRGKRHQLHARLSEAAAQDLERIRQDVRITKAEALHAALATSDLRKIRDYISARRLMRSGRLSK